MTLLIIILYWIPFIFNFCAFLYAFCSDIKDLSGVALTGGIICTFLPILNLVIMAALIGYLKEQIK